MSLLRREELQYLKKKNVTALIVTITRKLPIYAPRNKTQTCSRNLRNIKISYLSSSLNLQIRWRNEQNYLDWFTTPPNYHRLSQKMKDKTNIDIKISDLSNDHRDLTTMSEFIICLLLVLGPTFITNTFNKYHQWIIHFF